MKHRIIKLLVLAVLGFVLGGALAWLQHNRETPSAPADTAMQTADGEAAVETSAALGAEYTLISEDGSIVTPETWQGQHKLVFFGFTHCPDVCPSTLTKLSSAMKKFGESASYIPVIFITVDPKRDTPDVMAEYTDNFDARIVGLTGSAEQVQQAIDSFKVYAAKEPQEQASDHDMADADAAEDMGEHHYMMQHSSYIYVMGPENELVDVIASDISVDEMAQEISEGINQPL